MSIILYKKKLQATESGLEVFTEKYVCIHETKCFYFCVREFRNKFLYVLSRNDETELQAAKRLKCLKKIAKLSSHFAFDTEEKALAHLKFMKKRQMQHMKRELLFIDKFLTTDLVKDIHGERVPGSGELVLEHLAFD